MTMPKQHGSMLMSTGNMSAKGKLNGVEYEYIELVKIEEKKS